MPSVKSPLPSADRIRFSLHEYACLRTELVWIYDHPPDKPRMTVDREPEDGNWGWYLRRGSLNFTFQNQTRRILPGQWLFLPEGRTSHHFSAEARLLSVHFRCQWPSGINLLNTRQGIIFRGEAHENLEKDAVTLEKLLRENFSAPSHHAYHNQTAEYGKFLQLQSLFLGWLQQWTEACLSHGAHWSRLQSGDPRVLIAVRCLNEAPPSNGFPRERLARQTDLSPLQLNRLFFQEFGSTTRKYWEKRLIQSAREALRDPGLPIKELSYRLGFRSDSLFINWFRRLEGCSPGRFRNRLNQKDGPG